MIHAGARSTVWGRWEDFYRTNVAGTALVAELCLENGIERLVYISSPSIYTVKCDRYDIREEQAPKYNDLNHYIRSKLSAERVVEDVHQKGLETVILPPEGADWGWGYKSCAPAAAGQYADWNSAYEGGP